MAWDIQMRSGSLYLPQIDWWLDAHFPTARSFVSHAHFDHLALHREIICSPGTARLMRARMPGERTEHILPFGQTEQLRHDTTITLFPAGHIYGSAQCLLSHPDHGSLLYTGDFKLRPGLSAEPCATPRADVLIMETTYGLPRYVLPPTDEVLAAIVRFCHATLGEGETPVIFGYSLGKSQEILSSLAGAQLPVMLHPQTLKLTRVYEELGLTFPAYREYSAEKLAGHVVICPPQPKTSTFLSSIPRPRTAIITGWALDPGATFRYQCDAAFPLSDHADFTDLLRFVELVQPSRVLTLHGFSAQFALTLRERGIDAWAINQPNQLELAVVGAKAMAPSPTIPSRDDREPQADDFAAFCRLAEDLKLVPLRPERIARVQAYLARLSTENAALASLYLTGQPLARSSGRKLNLTSTLVQRALIAAAGLPESDYRAATQRAGDLGDAAETVLSERISQSPFSIAELATLFEDLARTQAPTAIIELLHSRLAGLSPLEAKYLIRIILGHLRIGLKDGCVEEAVALVTQQPVEQIRAANLLCGDLAEVTRAAFSRELELIQPRIFHPIPFMLGSPVSSSAALLEQLTSPVWLEDCYEGLRCQLHKQGDRVALFARDLVSVTEQFPDVVRAAQELPGDCILDGVLLAWRAIARCQ